MPKRDWQYALDLEKLRKSRGGKCENCPSSKKLEFAHLKPTSLHGRGRGLRRRYLDILRYPHHYSLLCRPCHKAFDAGLIVISIRNAKEPKEPQDQKECSQ